MLTSGHEGPYALEALEQRCLQGQLDEDAGVWSEGLDRPLPFKEALRRSGEDLPPLPLDEEDLPPLPSEEASAPSADPAKPRRHYALGAGLALGLLGFTLYQWVRGQENFVIHRHGRMSVELHHRIMKDLTFKGWDQKIFFKEYVPVDMSQVWLVTSSFQECQVEADFQSVKGKLISRGEESIAFKSKGLLKGHVVEFSAFDFRSGSKIVPGLYELDVRATDCVWDTLAAKLGNALGAPEEEYVARMKVILYPKGPEEFNRVLDNLLKKKMDAELIRQNKEEVFWQDLQQKFQTLLAVSLQIEQLFLDFLDDGPSAFKRNLPVTVDAYTKKFGHFLADFVVANEHYFKQMGEMEGRSQKRNYELMVRTSSKNIGHESMRVIEELQRLKNPTKSQLGGISVKLKKSFTELKKGINQKITQISEDRSR